MELLIQDIGYRYPKSNDFIFRHINKNFSTKFIYLIVGENGSGKTTFLKLLLGLQKPTEGHIQRIAFSSTSYLPDHNGLYEEMTVEENIKFRLALYYQDYSAKRAEIQEYLTHFRLLKKRNFPVSALSLGTKKKVAIICAMIVEADLLVLDEPTVGLDESAKYYLGKKLLESCNGERIIICSTHDSSFENALSMSKEYFRL